MKQLECWSISIADFRFRIAENRKDLKHRRGAESAKKTYSGYKELKKESSER